LSCVLELEKLIVSLGFNTEILEEQPSIVRQNGGGLRIWQYPNQFARYLFFLQNLKITSYLEIGCRWGGTFILTTEYLQRFEPLQSSVAVDLIDSLATKQYCVSNPIASFEQFDSKSAAFRNWIQDKQFDLIFIDGDHSYEGVKGDYESCKGRGRVFVFHDIVNANCPGVCKFWQELKQQPNMRFLEFVDQYEEVWQRTQKKFLGIGVAIPLSP